MQFSLKRKRLRRAANAFLDIKSLGHTPLMNWISSVCRGLDWLTLFSEEATMPSFTIFYHRSFKPTKMEKETKAQWKERRQEKLFLIYGLKVKSYPLRLWREEPPTKLALMPIIYVSLISRLSYAKLNEISFLFYYSCASCDSHRTLDSPIATIKTHFIDCWWSRT